MPAQSTIRRLTDRIDALLDQRNTNAPVLTVFANETPQAALAKHLELRPEHRGQQFRVVYDDHKRTEAREALAVCTIGEIKAVLVEIWAAGTARDIARETEPDPSVVASAAAAKAMAERQVRRHDQVQQIISKAAGDGVDGG